MKTKELSEKLVDCAIDLAVYSVPGMPQGDKDAMQAYKSLAADLILRPQKSLKRIIPLRAGRLRAK